MNLLFTHLGILFFVFKIIVSLILELQLVYKAHKIQNFSIQTIDHLFELEQTHFLFGIRRVRLSQQVQLWVWLDLAMVSSMQILAAFASLSEPGPIDCTLAAAVDYWHGTRVLLVAGAKRAV